MIFLEIPMIYEGEIHNLVAQFICFYIRYLLFLADKKEKEGWGKWKLIHLCHLS